MGWRTGHSVLVELALVCGAQLRSQVSSLVYLTGRTLPYCAMPILQYTQPTPILIASTQIHVHIIQTFGRQVPGRRAGLCTAHDHFVTVQENNEGSFSSSNQFSYSYRCAGC